MSSAETESQPKRKSLSDCPPLDRAVRKIDQISTLPHVALRVMEIAGDPESAAVDLKAAMENDASLSARVLRYVNSSAVALRSRIGNLQQAIAYLGAKVIRNLAMTAAVSELFEGQDSIGTYSRSELWRHLVSVGVCARMVAVKANFDNAEDVFLAGLLHDVGIILEDQYQHEKFVKMIATLDDERTLCDVERHLLGFDHAMLGQELGHLWGFPEPVLAAIRYHHMSVNYRGAEINTVRCVEVANLVCTLKGCPSVGRKLVRFSKPAFAALELTPDDMIALNQEFEAELEKNSGLFQI